ncbi:MAG: N-acyl homoserine lactonase family protein [Bacteroidota bacterium]
MITQTFATPGGPVKVHGIQTGRLAIKRAALTAKRPGPLSTLRSFADKEFGDWLPVWAWLVEHPTGRYLIDTGLTTDVLQKGFFRSVDRFSRYYFEKQMRFDISPSEEIDAQLASLGLGGDAIDRIFLTHLHIDHSAGLKHFPNTSLVVNQREWDTMDGSFPGLLPTGLQVEKIPLEKPFKNFERSAILTADESFMMVETPGHTRGHSSVFLRLDEGQYLVFAGDIAYNQRRLEGKVFSATIQNAKRNARSCEQMLAFAKDHRLLLLPSHDPENGARLGQGFAS